MAAHFGFAKAPAAGQVVFAGQVVVAPVAAPADAKAAIDAQAQQFEIQFRPLLVTELGFIRQICGDLVLDERVKIKAAGEASLKDGARQLAEFQQVGMRARAQVQANGKRIVAPVAPAKPQPEPAKIIRAGLAAAMKETITPEQMATTPMKRRSGLPVASELRSSASCRGWTPRSASPPSSAPRSPSRSPRIGRMLGSRG